MSQPANHAADFIMAGVTVGATYHVLPTLAVVLPIVWFAMEIVIHAPEFIEVVKGFFRGKEKK